MDDRHIGLIQRAAARLKQGDAASPNRPAGNAPAARLVEGKYAPAREARPRQPDVTIDRDRLTASGIALPSAERSRLAEEFRLIKHQILETARRQIAEKSAGRSARLILVTSARPLEGKTFVSANLALAIASEHDYRVLAIDGDSARQSLGEMLGVRAKSGLGDLLSGDMSDLSEILFHTDIPNLTVIPFGHRYANMPEMLSSNRMRTLLEEMALRYADRFVVIDAPPCLATSEPSILAPLVGQIVVVVEANKTQREEVEQTLRLVSACPHVSLVLNKTSGNSSDEFGSYGYDAPRGRP
jgi:exopolysaccharide/PEP-CTERM locus tyrosine autokinase